MSPAKATLSVMKVHQRHFVETDSKGRKDWHNAAARLHMAIITRKAVMDGKKGFLVERIR